MITGRDLIEKLYSEYEEEERTFSVEMDEETLSLFSDFCEEYGIDLYQKSFGVVKATNKAAKRAWEISQGQRKGLSKLLKGKLPEEQAIINSRFARSGKVMDDVASRYVDKNGKISFKNLNTKINQKGIADSKKLREGIRYERQLPKSNYDHMDRLNQNLIDEIKKAPTKKKLK